MLKEFKEFISKGNVLDLAVGLIMATYFGAIVKSLVNDLLMPFIGSLMGDYDITKLKYVLTEAKAATETTEAIPEVSINYGVFINTVITFIFVAFSVFLVVKAYNNMKKRIEKKKEEAPAAPPAPTKDQELLTEIRDLLKK